MKKGDYEIIIKKGDQELDSIPDDLPVIDFDGNEVTLSQAKEGMMRQKDYTQKTQEVAEVKRFLQNDLGFSDAMQGVATMKNVLSKLAEAEDKGIIDPRTGEFIVPESTGQKPITPSGEGEGDDSGAILEMDMLPPEVKEKLARADRLEKDVGSMMSYLVRREIKDDYPAWENEEIDYVMQMATADVTKTPMQHAQLWDEKKKALGQAAIDQYVEDQKKPAQDGHARPGTGEGEALEVFGENPVFSYDPESHQGKNVLDPGKAADEYMKRVMKDYEGD